MIKYINVLYTKSACGLVYNISGSYFYEFISVK